MKVALTLAKIIAALVVVVIGIVGLLLALVQTERGRTLACSTAFDAVNGAIPGAIVVERCASLTPRFIRLEGVQVHDPQQREIAHAEAIEVEPDWPTLLSGTIGIRRVNATAPRVRLVDYGEELAIVAAFVSPTDETDDPNDSGIDVVIDSIEVVDGIVTDLPNGTSVRRIRGETNLAVRELVSLDVAHVEAEVTLDDGASVNVLNASGKLRFGEEARVQVDAVIEMEGQKARIDANFDGTPERFSLDTTVRALGGRLRLDGRNEAGKLEVQLDVTDLDVGKTKWVEGGVAEGKVHAFARFSEPTPALDALERVKIEGHLGLASLRLSGMGAREIDVEADIEGRLPTPTARVVVRADGVDVAGSPVERLGLTLTGENGRYSVQGRAPLPNGWVAGADLYARVEWPVIHLDGNASLDGSPWSPVVATFFRVEFEPGDRLVVGSLSVEGKGVRLSARGRYGFEDESDVSFEIRSLNLARMSRAFDLGLGLTGTLRGSGTLAGTRDRLELDTTFDLDEGSIEGLAVQSLRGELGYVPGESARANLDLNLGDQGAATLRADAKLRRASGPSEAFRAARYDARLAVESLSVDIVTQLVDALPPLQGKLSAEVTLRGPLDSVDFDLSATGLGIFGPSLHPTDVQLSTSLRGDVLHATLEAETDEGGMMQASAEARVNLPKLLRGAPLATIANAPWAISVEIPEQRWSALPIDIELSTPARVSLALQANGGDAPIVADVDVDLRMPRASSVATGPSDQEPRSVCTAGEPARLRARVRLRDEQTHVEVEGFVAREHVFHGEGQMETRVSTWAREGLPSKWPSATAQVKIDPIELASVPVLCEQAAGELEARLQAKDLFQPSQAMSLQLDLRDLRFDNDVSVDVLVRASGTGTAATAEARILDGDHELAEVFAHVPLDVGTPGAPLGLGAGEISASADFDEAPLSVLLAPLPWVARPSGRLNGNLTAVGPARDLSSLKVQGDIRLAKASMTLKDPFLRLDEVDADLHIEPSQLLVRSLTARDHDGRVDVQGSIGLSGWEPSDVDVTLRADQFPLRRDGVIMATFNGHAELTGDLSSAPRSLRLALGQEVSLQLPENAQYGGVRDLSQHPLVIYRGQPGFDHSLTVQQALAEHRKGEPEAEEAPPLIVRVRSTQPFWVRRPDFSLQLSVDLEVHSEEEATWLQGSVDVRRGFLALLNKNFDIQSGTIQFTGATPVDPTVDLSATHRLNTGYSVTVDVKGSVSDPELTFSSDAPDANTNAEIIALLLGTSRQGVADAEADDQTRSVLAGLTAGLVGSITRRELGQYAPIIAVESEGTLGTTGVRAGFTVGDLIPEAWQSVLLGVYVEGLLGGSEQGPRGGFLIELLFPHYLSTTTTYEQPDNWSLDFLWQP